MGGKVVLSEDDLIDLCREWQKRLRLQDWTFCVQMVRYADMGERVGNCEWWRNERRALIEIMRPEDWPEGFQLAHADPELVLVHELLHLVLIDCSPDDGDEPRERGQEQAIHDLAGALVALKRAPGRPEGASLYVCPKCGVGYEDVEDARHCIDSHKREAEQHGQTQAQKAEEAPYAQSGGLLAEGAD